MKLSLEFCGLNSPKSDGPPDWPGPVSDWSTCLLIVTPLLEMSEEPYFQRLVTANHTHTWWYNMSPLSKGRCKIQQPSLSTSLCTLIGAPNSSSVKVSFKALCTSFALLGDEGKTTARCVCMWSSVCSAVNVKCCYVNTRRY